MKSTKSPTSEVLQQVEMMQALIENLRADIDATKSPAAKKVKQDKLVEAEALLADMKTASGVMKRRHQGVNKSPVVEDNPGMTRLELKQQLHEVRETIADRQQHLENAEHPAERAGWEQELEEAEGTKAELMTLLEAEE